MGLSQQIADAAFLFHNRLFYVVLLRLAVLWVLWAGTIVLWRRSKRGTRLRTLWFVLSVLFAILFLFGAVFAWASLQSLILLSTA